MLIIALTIFLFGCDISGSPGTSSAKVDEDNPKIYKQGPHYVEYDLSDSNGRKYSYFIYDKSGDIILHEEGAAMVMPEISYASENIIQIVDSAGTSLTWYQFCDVETGKVSESYDNVVHVSNNRIFRIKNNDDALTMEIHDIFKKGEFDKIVKRDFSRFGIITGCIKEVRDIDERNIELIYFEGNDKHLKTETIELGTL
jgi:hypothetical protein